MFQQLNNLTSFEVEDKCDSTLQFSASAEFQEPKCPCVRPLVTKSYGTSRHLIFPKLCMKLEDNKNRKLTRPDFPGKIRIIQ